MRPNTITLSALALAGIVFLSTGCSSGKSLAEACQEVQERDCQNNNVDCERITRPAFARLVDASDCSAELDDVEECLGDAEDICEEMCGPEGQGLSDCLTVYCNATQDPLCSEVASPSRI